MYPDPGARAWGAGTTDPGAPLSTHPPPFPWGRPRSARALPRRRPGLGVLFAVLIGLLAAQHALVVHDLEHLFHDHHDELCELCLHAQGTAGALPAPALPTFAPLSDALDSTAPSDPPARPVARLAHPVRAPPVPD